MQQIKWFSLNSIRLQSKRFLEFRNLKSQVHSKNRKVYCYKYIIEDARNFEFCWILKYILLKIGIIEINLISLEIWDFSKISTRFFLIIVHSPWENNYFGLLFLWKYSQLIYNVKSVFMLKITKLRMRHQEDRICSYFLWKERVSDFFL